MGLSIAVASAPSLPEAWLSWLPVPRGVEDQAPPEQQTIPTTTIGAPTPQPQHELSVLATVAHELRGPLTALATSSELLAEDFEILEAEQVRRMLAAMHRRTVWLQGLVENLLCAATIREGRLQLQAKPLDLIEVIADVQAVVEPLLAQKQQHLRIRAGGEVPTVLGDARRLGQALVNLVLNASKFSDAGTVIDVALSVRGGRVRVSVADRGPGLPLADADRLFEPYYRASAAKASGTEGVGLGLSVVKSIIEALGGRVGAENRRGGGARFWVELSAHAADPSTSTSTSTRRVRTRS